MADNAMPPSEPAGAGPAPEKTVPQDPAPGPGGRETVTGKASAPTVKDGQVAGVRQQPPGEPTLAQDEKERHSAQQISLAGDMRPDVPGHLLEERLGQGTYGVVWRASEVSTGKQVAIKFFHRRMGEMWQLVWAEIKQLALLDSVPGIVQLKDAEPDATPPYFIMSFAEGGSLAALLKSGALPVPRSVKLFHEMVEALAYVHAKGIRHCDLKPANILLDVLGKPLIADFGQSHLSMESQASSVNLGTFYYMAPEQADLSKQIPDTRWDVYGAGAIFYRMLVGAPPRESAGLTEELNQTAHLGSRLERYREGVAKAPAPVAHRRLPGVDRSLADIIDKCLQLNPAQRFQNASEILKALDQRERYLRQRPMLVLGLVASLLLVFGLGGLAFTLVHYAVRDAQETLQTQILGNDKTIVRLIANVVGEKLGALKDTVQRVAENEHLVAKVREFFAELKPGQIKAKSYIDNPSTAALEDHLVHRGFRPGISLFIVYDLDGHLLAGGYPEANPDNSPEGLARRAKRRQALRALYGVNYSYRDYYHGKGDNQLAPGAENVYLGRTYVSEPYVSTLAEDGDNPVLLGISTPIYELKHDPAKGRPVPDSSRPIGILIGFIYLNDLHGWLDSVDVKSGGAVLLNQHGQCIYHTDAKERRKLKPQPGVSLKRWTQTRQAIAEQHMQQRPDYADEMTGVECLASFAALPADRWGAMVLHYRDEVFQAIQDLRSTLFRVIFVVAGICAALHAGLWVWLLRALRGREIVKAS